MLNLQKNLKMRISAAELIVSQIKNNDHSFQTSLLALKNTNPLMSCGVFVGLVIKVKITICCI